MILQPAVVPLGIALDQLVRELHGGGAVVEEIPAAVVIAQAQMRRDQYVKGAERRGSKLLHVI